MTQARRNHYNPCFWTALWNREYFRAFVNGEATNARAQPVSALNIRGNKILEATVATLFYDTDVAVAPITPESMVRFAERYHPDKAAASTAISLKCCVTSAFSKN